MELLMRLIAVLSLPILASACIGFRADPGAVLLFWTVLAVGVDAVSRRVTPAAPRLGDHAATALCISAPLLQSLVLMYALFVLPERSDDAVRAALVMVVVGVSAGTIGISAAHELIHRRQRVLRLLGHGFMLLVSYPQFPLVHLRVHHPFVGTPLDPGTSRLNEPLLRYLGRAYLLSWRSGWQVERARLAGLGTRHWSWHNELIRAVLVQLIVYAAILAAFGVTGVALFALQSAVAVALSFTIDYTQHYGVVRRETAAGRLERFSAHHAWTSDQQSNRSMFDLGLHAAHHLKPAVSYERLGNPRQSLQNPYGYPGLLLLAMVPRLWFGTMNPRLAAANRDTT